MKSIVKIGFILGILVTAWLIPTALDAHLDVKNIKEGVFYPMSCSEHAKLEDHTLSCALEVGEKNGYYIVSPARRYDIRKEDTGKVLEFLKTNQSTKVHAKLAIHTREGEIEIWKVTELIKR